MDIQHIQGESIEDCPLDTVENVNVLQMTARIMSKEGGVCRKHFERGLELSASLMIEYQSFLFVCGASMYICLGNLWRRKGGLLYKA